MKLEEPGDIVPFGKLKAEDPLNEIALLELLYVGVPMDVPFAELPDLSTHVVTVAPFDGGVPVPAGSAPSSQRAQPAMEVGLNWV